MYIDTHTHLYKEYYEDIDKVIKDARDSGIFAFIVSGVNDSNKEILELAHQYDDVYLSLGYHPTELKNIKDKSLEQLEKEIQDKKVIAIGEIGLDYHYDDTDEQEQKAYFIKQIELAKKYDLPVVIHSRDANQDTYDILKNYAPLKGVMHCYSYSLESAKMFISLGLCLGIGGVVTFKNAVTLVKVVEEIPLSYIVLETDAPYLTPEPYRKEANASKYIPIIASKVALIKGIPVGEVMETTTATARALFDF